MDSITRKELQERGGMLVLNLQPDEAIEIGTPPFVTTLSLAGRWNRLGIQVDKSVPIQRVRIIEDGTKV